MTHHFLSYTAKKNQVLFAIYGGGRRMHEIVHSRFALFTMGTDDIKKDYGTAQCSSAQAHISLFHQLIFTLFDEIIMKKPIKLAFHHNLTRVFHFPRFKIYLCFIRRLGPLLNTSGICIRMHIAHSGSFEKFKNCQYRGSSIIGTSITMNSQYQD